MDPTESGESKSIEGAAERLYPWVRSADFDRVYLVVAGSAFRTARARTDHDTASDIAQQVTDTLAEAWKSGAVQFETDEAAEAWAASQAQTRLLRARRKQARRRDRESSYGVALDDQRRDWMDPAATMDQSELRDVIRRALESVPPQCRRAWVMTTNGEPRRQVAEALGVQLQTASNYTLRAVEVLRRELAPVRDLWLGQEES